VTRYIYTVTTSLLRNSEFRQPCIVSISDSHPSVMTEQLRGI